nr:hypothetical protein [Faecalibaculum rodentium]
MNTRIDYLYRDAANYKLYGHVVIPGEITEKQIQKIMKFCLPFDGETRQFIPELIGFPVLKFDLPSDDDHPCCEISPKCFSPTEEKPTIKLSAKRLVMKFHAASQTSEMQFYREWVFTGFDPLNPPKYVDEIEPEYEWEYYEW